MRLTSRSARRTSWMAVIAAIAAACGLASPSVHAQTPPPGALFDLQATHPATLSSYQQFSFGFVAGSANTTVSFAFREVPAYFAFDDASVVLNGTSTNLLANPGFESATVGQTTPTSWGRFIQPVDVTAIGQVSSVANPYGCPPNAAHGGTLFWCDGSVQGYDGLFQTLPTTIGASYTVSFWLGDNAGRPPVNPDIDMLGYAENGLPTGTIPVGAVPEPETYALMLAGLGVMGLVARRRQRR